MKRILISTGGSGGHVIPAITLYDHYKENFETFLTTDKRGNKYINSKNYPCYIINTPKVSKNIVILPYNLFLFFTSIIKSFFYLRKKKNRFFIKYRWLYVFTIMLMRKIIKNKNHSI